MPQSIDPYDLPPLTEALGRLPNVKRRKGCQLVMHARDRIFERFTDELLSEGEPDSQYSVRVANGTVLGPGESGGFELTMDDIEEMFCTERSDEPGHVTPEGAATLISMYEEEVFELKRPSEGIGTPEKLREFAESREELEAKARAEEERRERERDKFRELVENPDQIDPDAVSPSLLDQVFWEHHGPGDAVMEIGGVRVRKSVAEYKSNSGKNKDHEVTFTWKDESGERRERLRESDYKRNRRNDPERNWGLPD